jgi:hypothetical protein
MPNFSNSHESWPVGPEAAPPPPMVGGGGGEWRPEGWQPMGEVRREVFYGGWSIQSVQREQKTPKPSQISNVFVLYGGTELGEGR